jgi:[ribosomal protein S18]-alanine N-acetyltransferase
MSLTNPTFAPAQATYWIGPMTEHDLLEVVEIEENSGLSRWGWAAYYAELHGPHRHLMLVARLNNNGLHGDGHRIAGYIVARLGAEELHINNVAVRANYRGQGIGYELIKWILTQGRKANVNCAFLELRAGNEAALALYEKCGFEVTSRRPRYYTDPVEDALVMMVRYRSNA